MIVDKPEHKRHLLHYDPYHIHTYVIICVLPSSGYRPAGWRGGVPAERGPVVRRRGRRVAARRRPLRRLDRHRHRRLHRISLAPRRHLARQARGEQERT